RCVYSPRVRKNAHARSLMQKVLCASIAALAAMLAPAIAADLSVAPIYNSSSGSPSGPAETWGGAYSARFGSGVWAPAATQDGTSGVAATSGFNFGGTAGMTSGVNFQKDKWVVGYESDATLTKKNNAIEIAPNVAWGGEVKER